MWTFSQVPAFCVAGNHHLPTGPCQFWFKQMVPLSILRGFRWSFPHRRTWRIIPALGSVVNHGDRWKVPLRNRLVEKPLPKSWPMAWWLMSVGNQTTYLLMGWSSRLKVINYYMGVSSNGGNTIFLTPQVLIISSRKTPWVCWVRYHHFRKPSI